MRAQSSSGSARFEREAPANIAALLTNGAIMWHCAWREQVVLRQRAHLIIEPATEHTALRRHYQMGSLIEQIRGREWLESAGLLLLSVLRPQATNYLLLTGG
eukprot:CAMPEP_0185591580 /NCGR_PEP_ID=MMETSP0434-20130131/64995_1 /TAXON_ID=626734 ORGANISM="Favella taraikaensis, Strain Fe Narragansett Bay" /NCGR_SAMPLE_ID=MMETSP0434 /ASSEMBLY_ACC=CAM_ASM_000379 /LENGTH=101 /DNA_ID=CAMNT_0028216711 /DNA_START=711 /DNA_END=1016 /DNA_ORIENTATION=+